VIDAPLWLALLLGALLFISALFSASETALFRLGREQAPRAGPAAASLIEKPRDLLISVKVGNVLVDVAFFLFAQRVVVAHEGLGEELIGGLVSVLAIVVFGDILPKLVALRAPLFVARLGAPALWILNQTIRPLRVVLGSLLELVTRALGPLGKSEPGLQSNELYALLERSAERGQLEGEEADLLYEVVELREVRVREIMEPRVDALFLDVAGDNRAEIVARALERRVSWVPVVDGTPDQIEGRVRVRDLLTRPDKPVRQLVLPIKFVPEVASCLDLLHVLREERQAEAVVVDEWGGTAGVVDIERVFEEIVGDLRQEDERRAQPVVPLGAGRFRVAGGLSVRDWNEAFGVELVPSAFETLGGFVTAQLGRVPRPGDEFQFGHLRLCVHEVRGRRVLAVDVGVAEPGLAEVGLAEQGGAAP
jgi:CBS domain containing-hemolysin-like protein